MLDRARQPVAQLDLGLPAQQVARRAMSGWRTLGSSIGSASKTISERDSVTSTIASAISSRVISEGLPMFTGSCTPDSWRATRPRTRSSTKQNERVWEPSPNTVTGRSASAWPMKAGMARPSLARMRGP